MLHITLVYCGFGNVTGEEGFVMAEKSLPEEEVGHVLKEDAGWGERLQFGLRAIEASRTVFASRFERPPYRELREGEIGDGKE